MLKDLEEKMKIRKWDWIPFVGMLMYSVRVDFFINWNYGGTKMRKIIRRPRSIFTTVVSLVGMSFSITGFVLKYGYHWGGFPWPFIVAICIGLSSMVTVKIPELQFKKGLANFNKLPEEERASLFSAAEIKREETEVARQELFAKKKNKK